MATSTPIGLFYKPGAPPPPLPLLTAQTDLLGNSPRPSTLTNAEVLPRSGPPRVPSHSRRTQVTLSRPSRSTCDSTPSDSPPASDLSDSSGSDSSELSDSDSSTDSDVAKIPKPPGEAGRPGRGGYTLEEALDWNPKMYKKLKGHVYSLIDNHLDTTKCYSGQALASLQFVCSAAADKYPDVDDYCGRWPVTDLIKLRLKNTSSQHRKLVQKAAAGRSGGKEKLKTAKKSRA